ncbi:hypothetical protein [Rhizobium herbae]|uniref:Uncharacterized protein n=1 Tax=Rhizobium herbae TaxID=508661 RepID=A0ABS4EPA4_9HYPH|nr:hypothetical protein [Rhizobium herbae]MBP1859779.1 hypothetical protein [Rhizobium herbae]
MFDKARSIQIAWFLPFEPPAPAELFDAITGQEPDAFQKVSPPNAPFPIITQVVNRGNVQHRVQSHIGRVDYFIEAIATEQPVGMLDAPLVHLAQALSRIALIGETLGEVTRVAIILNLCEKVGSFQESAAIFNKLFSNHITLTDDRDLMFQTSRRTGDSTGYFNRLLRWSTEYFSFQQIVNGVPAAGMSLVESYYVNYMIDVNTVPAENVIFQPSEHSELFARVAAIADGLTSLGRIEDLQ